jgi:hypothetical protein
MGNIFGHKHLAWNQRQILQSWIPLLLSLFTYDNVGNIAGLNASYFNQNFHAANDQLRTLPLLLKGRSGVDRKMLRKIKSLQNSASAFQQQQHQQNGNVQDGNVQSTIPSSTNNNFISNEN